MAHGRGDRRTTGGARRAPTRTGRGRGGAAGAGLAVAATAAVLGLLLPGAAGCERRREPALAPAAAVAAAPVVPKRVRPPAVAGSWYSADARALGAEIDRLLDAAGGPERLDAPIRALVVPHAGYAFSGPTAAEAYRLVRGAAPRRVIVLGTAHRGLRGASVLDVTHYDTPLGEVPVDRDAVARLRAEPLFGADAAVDAPEHSVEIQLPFLQRALAPGWTLVPVLVGHLGPGEAARLAAALRAIADDSTLVVASGDFTHFGRSYGYTPFPVDERTADRLRQLDEGAFAPIAARDPDGLEAYHARTGVTVCGLYPFLVLAHMLPADARAHQLRYDTSGARGGDYSTSVSYLAAAFAGPHSFAAAEDVLLDEELVTLHRLAVRTVVTAVRSGEAAADALAAEPAPSARLARLSGTFVTLKKRGELRGCIGAIVAREPLWRSIVHSATSAALRDPRFAPVTEGELFELTLEVSVLSPLRPIPSWREFRVGEQGLVLEKEGAGAVFLPEVAREQGWSREETLSRLAQKAGLAPDAWRDGARFQVFTTQIHEAPLLPGDAGPRP